MKKIAVLLTFLCLTIGLACQSAKMSSSISDDTSVGADGANRITLVGAKKLFDLGDVLFVDTRPKATYDSEHIKNAINVPVSDVESRLADLKTDKKIVAYCS